MFRPVVILARPSAAGVQRGELAVILSRRSAEDAQRGQSLVIPSRRSAEGAERGEGSPATSARPGRWNRPIARSARVALASALCALLLLACQNQKRSITVSASEAQRVIPVREVPLQPGAHKLSATDIKNPYEGNAYAISQGQQLFAQYNCVGCHFHGGGGIGPPLMDAEWIYGSTPAQIYETISEGRPNGMPSFGGHIPDYQIWYLVSYVRALGGLESKAVVSPRAEEMQSKKAEEPKQ